MQVRKIILSTQKNKYGECAVYVEILRPDNHKYIRINTDIRVKPSDWSKKKGEVLKSDGNFQSKNDEISRIYSRILSYSLSNDTEFRAIVNKEYPQLKDLFPETINKRKNLTDYFEEYINLRKVDGSARGTWKEYISVKNRLFKYGEHLNKTLSFADMNLTFSDNFGIWMLNDKKYNSGTVEKTFTVIKTFLGYYFKRQKELNIVLSDLFKDREFKKGNKSLNLANPLTLKEFKFLAQYDFKEDLRMVRTKDMFILQCSTGLRYGDIDKIIPSMIINNRIKINPTKTQETKQDNTIYIDLNKYSKQILSKYNFDTSCFKISNQKYNQNLKVMFGGLGMPLHTSHEARDSFISICIYNKVSVPIILSWTGQSSYSVMKRYIKLDDMQLKDEMNRVFS